MNKQCHGVIMIFRRPQRRPQTRTLGSEVDRS